MPTDLKSGSLKHRKPSGPVQASNGIALPLLVKGSCGGKTEVILQNLSEYKIVHLRYSSEFYHDFQAIFHRTRTKCLQRISVNIIRPNNETSDILYGQNAEVLK